MAVQSYTKDQLKKLGYSVILDPRQEKDQIYNMDLSAPDPTKPINSSGTSIPGLDFMLPMGSSRDSSRLFGTEDIGMGDFKLQVDPKINTKLFQDVSLPGNVSSSPQYANINSDPISADPFMSSIQNILKNSNNSIGGAPNNFNSIYSNPKLTSEASRFSNLNPNSTNNNNFQDLVKNIGAPSSVDEVTNKVYGDIVQQAMDQIDLDTKNSLANNKLDALDRGIGGAGQSSDIESNAAAQIQSEADVNKSNVRSQLALQELNQEKQKELALQNAYANRYTQQADIESKGALFDAAELNNLLGTQYKTEQNALLQGGLQSQNLGSQQNIELAKLLSAKDLTSSDQANQIALQQLKNQNADEILNKQQAFQSALNPYIYAGNQGSQDDFWTQLLKTVGSGIVGNAVDGGSGLGGNLIQSLMNSFSGPGSDSNFLTPTEQVDFNTLMNGSSVGGSAASGAAYL